MVLKAARQLLGLPIIRLKQTAFFPVPFGEMFDWLAVAIQRRVGGQ
jgi:hypothetical protein